MRPSRASQTLICAAALLLAAAPTSALGASWQPPFTLAGGSAGATPEGVPAFGLSSAGSGIAAWSRSLPARANGLVVTTRASATPFAAPSPVAGPLGNPLLAVAGPAGAHAVVAEKIGSRGAVRGLAIRVWHGLSQRRSGFSAGGSPTAVHAGFTTGGTLIVSWFDRSQRTLRVVAGLPNGSYSKPVSIASFARASEGSDYGLSVGPNATVVWLSNGARRALLIAATISPTGSVSSFSVIGAVPRTATGLTASATPGSTASLVAWRTGSSIVVADASGRRRTTIRAGGKVTSGPFLATARGGRGIVAWTTGSTLHTARTKGATHRASTALHPLAAKASIDDVVLASAPSGRAVLAWREHGAASSVRAIVGSGALRSPQLLATGAIAGIDASIAADGTAGVIWSGTEAGGWPAIRLAYNGASSAAVTP